MKTMKFLTITFVALAVMFAQAGSAFAAPAAQDTTITGTVTGLACGTDGSIEVTVLAADGTSQTYNLDAATAAGLGLVTLDADGNPDCTAETLDAVVASNAEVTIDPTTVLTADEEEDSVHPVAWLLSEFFSDTADYDAIMEAHEDGAGFGVIAQALWYASSLEDSEVTFQDILLAKQTGIYDNIKLADGSTPRNWGDIVKAIKKGDNLGKVMSDKENKGNSDNGHGKPENTGKPENSGKPENTGKPENPGNGNNK